MLRWLFFDVGSTLVDETLCEEMRIKETVRNTDISAEEFYKCMSEFAKENKNAYKCTLDKYKLSKVRWNSEYERLYPDVAETLKLLKSKYYLGIIANQSFGLYERLSNLNISQYFDVVISSADVGIAKPNQGIFEMALKKAECTAKEACMIGDRIDNDIIPAQQAGMKTVWVKQGFGGMGKAELLSKKPDYVVDCIKDLLNIFL